MQTLRLSVSRLLAIACALFLFASAAGAEEAPIKILALGDSLTAGYGLDDLKDAFPAQLEAALKAKGHNVTLLQGGISGDTTTGGRARLEWSLGGHPDAVIVELGANDALRAVDPKLTEENLVAIVKRFQQEHIPVLLAGMMAPPNLGRDYTDRFNAIYPKIAKDSGVLLYPFFLDGVAAVPTLNQADRMHPTPAGVKVIVAKILPSAEKLVAAAEAQRRKP
jgi:acyl-CoA thioesterase-1